MMTIPSRPHCLLTHSVSKLSKRDERHSQSQFNGNLMSHYLCFMICNSSMSDMKSCCNTNNKKYFKSDNVYDTNSSTTLFLLVSIFFCYISRTFTFVDIRVCCYCWFINLLCIPFFVSPCVFKFSTELFYQHCPILLEVNWQKKANANKKKQ